MKLPKMSMKQRGDTSNTLDDSTKKPDNLASTQNVRPSDCGCDPGNRCIGPCFLGSCAGQCVPW